MRTPPLATFLSSQAVADLQQEQGMRRLLLMRVGNDLQRQDRRVSFPVHAHLYTLCSNPVDTQVICDK
jgi:hypothetical protein